MSRKRPARSMVLRLATMLLAPVLLGAVLPAGVAGTTGIVTFFPALDQDDPNLDSPRSIVTGPDGNLWITDVGMKAIVRMTKAGVTTKYPLPAESGTPNSITVGPDGAIWFTAESGYIGRITTAGSMQTWTPEGVLYPLDIVAGPDGNLWFADAFADAIGRITPAGVTTLFSTADTQSPERMTVGPDGNMWFTMYTPGWIGRITTAGVITVLKPGTTPSVSGIATAPDGNLYVLHGNGMAKVTTAGVVTPITSVPGGGSSDLRRGPDGRLWWADFNDGIIHAFSTTPADQAYAPVGLINPNGLGVGPDGNLWIVLGSGHVARMTVDGESTDPVATPPKTTPRTGVTLSGSSTRSRITWSGSDSGGSGLSHYILQRQVNGGAWTTVAPYLLRPRHDITLAKGTTYRFRARAVDVAANASPWAYGPTFTTRLAQNTSTAVTYRGTWRTSTSSVFSGGSARRSSTGGSSATFSFTGRSIAFVTTRATTRGKAKIYVNGTYVTTIDLFGATTTYRAVAWQKTWSTSKARTVRVVVSGTSTRPRVDVDAFVVFR